MQFNEPVRGWRDRVPFPNLRVDVALAGGVQLSTPLGPSFRGLTARYNSVSCTPFSGVLCRDEAVVVSCACSALTLNGVDAYLEASFVRSPLNPFSNTSFTVEAWVRWYSGLQQESEQALVSSVFSFFNGGNHGYALYADASKQAIVVRR
jgi:hypothetical protein